MSGDLSARDRLRDAAIESFARRGFGATVREIAADAGVTAGLITHHFGSRARLRTECDTEVLRRIQAINEDGLRRSPEQQLAMIGEIDAQGSTMSYALRLVRDGGPASRDFLERMVADSLGYLEAAVAAGVVKPSRDAATRARYLVATQFGGLLLYAELLGLDLADGPALVRRIAAETAFTALELYTNGLLANRSLLDQYLANQEEETVT
ncbi:TetR/AcrR family transcriptional regulator [Micropruina sonneratiae]|uniref:TetR/AcrR family transcriptional regulator n=1 Tax=Micropruina sonneratiae TaxID=2986940 RepID=UPI002225DFEA|nr:TetR family transcriptional regulator [Micropruina sp. KQZ13P-5]MCW3159589.1 TetR family transcriptional regulator [Micropruina sp. KQZ13P-5]